MEGFIGVGGYGIALKVRPLKIAFQILVGMAVSYVMGIEQWS